MKKTVNTIVLLTMLALGMADTAKAACPAKNTAFQSGERLEYALYFNWKFVWVNAGTATMTIDETKWEGKTAYKSHLITKTSKKVDKFFMMRDTLQAVVSQDMIPLYYKKGANEGGKYYEDQVWYSYKNGKTQLKQQYVSRSGEVSKTTNESDKCIYDMMSMMLRARSFQVSDFKVGSKVNFPMADGRKTEDITLIYRGKKNFKMKGNGTEYRCLIFSFVEYENKKEKEIITFYITDDENHLPVRLDMFLKFGTAKAYLNSYKGIRHEVTSIIRK